MHQKDLECLLKYRLMILPPLFSLGRTLRICISNIFSDETDAPCVLYEIPELKEWEKVGAGLE